MNNGKNSIYSGGAFHEIFSHGRAAGSIRVTSSGIEFFCEMETMTLPLDHRIQMKKGGAANRLLFFSHPDVAGLSIFTDRIDILQHPLFHSNIALRAQVDSFKRSAWIKNGTLLFLAVLVMGIGFGLYVSRDTLVKGIANHIPTTWEVAIGEMVFKQIISNKKLIDNENIHQQLSIITTPLIQAIDHNYPFEFHIVEEDQVNAFALPGGHVILHTGLLLRAENPEEIAGVIAHEIAHVTLRHSIRQMISTGGLYFIIQGIFGDIPGLLTIFADNSVYLLSRKFSRDAEREADSEGWEYLMRSSINPEGMISFFQKLEEYEKSLYGNEDVDTIQDSLNFLSTHPATEERILTLKEKKSSLPSNVPFITFSLDFPHFKNQLRSIVYPK